MAPLSCPHRRDTINEATTPAHQSRNDTSKACRTAWPRDTILVDPPSRTRRGEDTTADCRGLVPQRVVVGRATIEALRTSWPRDTILVDPPSCTRRREDTTAVRQGLVPQRVEARRTTIEALRTFRPQDTSGPLGGTSLPHRRHTISEASCRGVVPRGDTSEALCALALRDT